MTPAQARRASRIEDMTRSLRDEMRSQSGEDDSCEQLSQALQRLQAARAASPVIGHQRRLPISISLPTEMLTTIRKLAEEHPDGQTGIIVKAIRESMTAAAPAETRNETGHNDARTSLRIPADIILLMDARVADMGTTRSHVVRMALSAIVPD